VEAIGEQVPEEVIQQAMALANTAVCDIIDTQVRLVREIKEKKTQEAAAAALARGEAEGESAALPAGTGKKGYFTVPAAMAEYVHALGYDRSLEVYSNGVSDKAARGRGEGKLRGELLQAVNEHPEWGQQHVVVRSMAVDAVMHKAFRAVLLRQSAEVTPEVRRSDGRALDEVRQIGSAVEVLPTVHGSSYFARGDTHVLSTVTLGSYKDRRTVLPIDGTVEPKEQTFMLHYDFPPYSTGEMGNATAPNRRMVGHGNLAEKALRPVLPSFDVFPYTVRVYCECTGSNGSSSMASACAGSLALYDAGVPLKAPVAAVSVGLVTDESVALDLEGASATAEADGATTETAQTAQMAGREYVILRDILGSEDHHGDMDYKIGGKCHNVQLLCGGLMAV
jgi:polyribonucleotide nucleotidyltransferase